MKTVLQKETKISANQTKSDLSFVFASHFVPSLCLKAFAGREI